MAWLAGLPQFRRANSGRTRPMCSDSISYKTAWLIGSADHRSSRARPDCENARCPRHTQGSLLYWKSVTNQVFLKIKGAGMKKRRFTTFHGFAAIATASSFTSIRRQPQPTPQNAAGNFSCPAFAVTHLATVSSSQVSGIETPGEPAALTVEPCPGVPFPDVNGCDSGGNGGFQGDTGTWCPSNRGDPWIEKLRPLHRQGNDAGSSPVATNRPPHRAICWLRFRRGRSD